MPGLFKVINSSTPCTQGVDLSSAFVPHSFFAKQSGQDSPGVADKLQIGFVDVEGQGDKDSTYDTMLALPLLLASKVVLFNHKGAPTVHDMLSKLGVLARAADYIELAEDSEDGDQGAKDDEEDDEEEEGDGEGDKAGGKSGASTAKFGHLHVLFRDFSFDAAKEDVYEQLLGKEKIKKTKLAAKAAKGGALGRCLCVYVL